MNEKDKITRRQAVTGMGATVAAIALAPVSAVEGDNMGREILKEHLAAIVTIDNNMSNATTGL